MDETLKKNAIILLAAGLIMMMLTGCGTPMYSLTDNEAGLIANYCANCVAKFNRFQGDGMVFVVNKTTAEQQAALTGNKPQVSESEPEDDTSIEFDDLSGGPILPEIPDEYFEVSPMSIGEILGYPELQVICHDVSTVAEYKEGTYLLLTPSDGNAYLVLNISVSNPTNETVFCDFIAKEPQFFVELPDGTRAASSGTILLDDFYTFQGNVEPGMTEETVALVEIPQTAAGNLSSVKIFLGSQGNSTELPLIN